MSTKFDQFWSNIRGCGSFFRKAVQNDSARNGHSDRLNAECYACMLHPYNSKGGPKPLASESGLWKEGA